jgi:serine/threonine-protein kinase RsbW
MSSRFGSPLPSPIVMVLPAHDELIRLPRLMASGVATTLGFPLAEVEDLRLAVDEVCSTLVEASDGAPMTVTFAVMDNCLIVSGSARARAALDDERLRLSRQILGVITDELDITRDDGTIRFRMARRMRAMGVG